MKKNKIILLFVVFITYLSQLFASDSNDSASASQINNVFITYPSSLFASGNDGNVSKASEPNIIDTLEIYLLNIIEIFLLLLLIGFIVWFVHAAWKSSKSLNILSIVNETGKEEFKGIAAGIDDILMANLQKINQLESSVYIKSDWTADSQIEKRQKGKLSAKAQKVELNAKAQKMEVVGSGFLMNFQQLGDVSLGPIKIPLGKLLQLIFNIFGGKNLSGALQKYGKINTIVLRLETRPFLLFFGKSKPTQYFEVSWPSETIKIIDLSEGVPVAIEELAYRIILSVGKEIGTEDWTAYKWFLKGYLAFNDFDRNETRKDRLSDAIECYRESVYIDPYFAKAHYNLGVALDRMGKDKDYNDAIFRYKQAINLAPEIIGAEAHFSLAKIYWDIFKDSDKALDELEKAEKFSKNWPDIYNLKGLIYLEKGGEAEKKKAAKWFQKAIDRCRENPKALFYYNYSVANYYLKNYKQAQNAAEEALKILKEQEEEKNRDLIQTLGMIHMQKASLNKEDETKKNEYQKALHYFEEGLKMAPENRDMLDAYGEVLRETGKIEEALIIQRRLIRLWPEYSRGYAEIAKTLKKFERYEDEIKIYKKVEEILKKDNEIEVLDALESKKSSTEQTIINMNVLGGYYLYDVKPEFDQAVNYYDNINVDFKTSSYLLRPEILHNYGLALMYYAKTQYKNTYINLQQRQELYDEASAKLELAQALYDKDSQTYDKAKCFTDLALLFEMSDDNNDFKIAQKIDDSYQQASKLYEKDGLFQLASDTHVLNAEYLNKLYVSILNPDLLLDARDDCDKAIQFDSKNASAYHCKGNTYYYVRDDISAIAQYEKAVELNYNLPHAHYNLGLCYFSAKEYEKAEKAFTTTIKLGNPTDPLTVNAYEQLFETFEKQAKWVESVKRFRKIVNLVPTFSSYQIRLGQALVQCNVMDEAADAFENVLKYDKDNGQKSNHIALYHLADIYAEQGANISEAYRMAKEALKIKREQLKEALRSIGNIKLQECKQLLKTDKELAEINNTLGWLYYQKNQPQKARLLLEKSLSHSMSNPKWHARLAYAYEKEAKTYSDASKKSNLLEKSKVQWEIVSDLPLDKNNLKQTAQEHLKSISQ